MAIIGGPGIWVLSRVEDEHAQAQAQDDAHDAGDDDRLDAVTLRMEESKRMQRWAMKKLSNQDGWEQRVAWLPCSMAVGALPRTHTTAILRKPTARAAGEQQHTSGTRSTQHDDRHRPAGDSLPTCDTPVRKSTDSMPSRSVADSASSRMDHL